MLKTFMTKDANGCQFEVNANYYTTKITDRYGFHVRTEKRAEYSAMGIVANTLEELKELIANI